MHAAGAQRPVNLYYKPEGFPSCRELLEIAESANPPYVLPSGPEWGEYEFPAKDGWKVLFFYDGELDYIDSFISPGGTVFDVWKYPDRSDGDDVHWCPLKVWGRVGDVVRLSEDGYLDRVEADFSSDPRLFPTHANWFLHLLPY
jgi:hypothetical protein